MKILVTGGAGFIGKKLMSSLTSEKHKVFSLDRNSIRDEEKIPGVTYITGDTLDIDDIKEKFDVIYHMGEYSRISTSFEDIEKVWHSNILGTFRVLQYCVKNNIKLIYGASSSKFGNEGQDEDLSPYSWTKSKNVELIKNYSSWFGLKYSIAYFYNVYGPGQTSTGKYSTVIGIFETQFLNKTSLTIAKPGTQKRVFTHIDDVVEGLKKLINLGENQEFSFGDLESEYTIEEVAKMFTTDFVYIDSKKGDRQQSPLDTTTSNSILNWYPKQNLKSYITRFKNER